MDGDLKKIGAKSKISGPYKNFTTNNVNFS